MQKDYTPMVDQNDRLHDFFLSFQTQDNLMVMS